MNFKEIAESVLEEVDGRGVQIASVALGRDTSGDLYLTNPTHRNVVKWVQEAYVDVQLYNGNWEFLHKRGKFLTVVANKDIYKKRNVREIKAESLYFIETGTTVRIPVYFRPGEYEWWINRERSVPSTDTTTPLKLIEAPDDDWIVWPTPTAGGAIYADWWMTPKELEDADDEPLWDSHYHRLLKWWVLELYATELEEEGSTKKIEKRVGKIYPPLWRAFQNDYLRSPVGPEVPL